MPWRGHVPWALRPGLQHRSRRPSNRPSPRRRTLTTAKVCIPGRPFRSRCGACAAGLRPGRRCVRPPSAARGRRRRRARRSTPRPSTSAVAPCSQRPSPNSSSDSSAIARRDARVVQAHDDTGPGVGARAEQRRIVELVQRVELLDRFVEQVHAADPARAPWQSRAGGVRRPTVSRRRARSKPARSTASRHRRATRAVGLAFPLPESDVRVPPDERRLERPIAGKGSSLACGEQPDVARQFAARPVRERAPAATRPRRPPAAGALRARAAASSCRRRCDRARRSCARDGRPRRNARRACGPARSP